MTSIEHTAYPELLQSRYRKTDLQFYQPTIDEINFMDAQNIRSDTHRLNFILQLKIFQQLHYWVHVHKRLNQPPLPKQHFYCHFQAFTARN